MNTTIPTIPFVEFPKIARLSREVVITEKIDGTNASIHITPEGVMHAGSRTRWITPPDDNYGFARWVQEHELELEALGPGTHFGEWWGAGVQRKYGQKEKRFSLFNTYRWKDHEGAVFSDPLDHEGQEWAPECCHVVPVLASGILDTNAIDNVMWKLREFGSTAAPGFMNPEGIVIYHTAAKTYFKKTLEKDESPKSIADVH